MKAMRFGDIMLTDDGPLYLSPEQVEAWEREERRDAERAEQRTARKVAAKRRVKQKAQRLARRRNRS